MAHFFLPDWISFDWPIIAVLIVLGIICLPYIVGPVLIYFTMRISCNPALDEFSLDSPALPDDAKEYLLPTVRRLQEDGFETLGAFAVTSFVPNVQSFVVLMANEQARQKALLAVMYAQTPLATELRQKHTEYSARFSDGTVLDTNNSEELSAFKALPEHIIVSLPWIQDVRYLYRIHRAAIEHLCPQKLPAWRMSVDGATDLREALMEEMAKQVTTGYLYTDANGDFRPTIKGAIIMTWKNIWPVTAILKARRRRKGQQLLDELQL